MNARRDPNRLIHDFLMEGETELADQVFDAVRDRIEQTRQRAVIGSWRMPDMNKIVTVGLAAAAVVVAIVIGAQLLGSPGGGLGGPGEPTATPEPTATLVPSAAATPESTAPEPTPAPLPEGPWVLVYEMIFGVRATVTIPAPDWYGFQYLTEVVKHGIAAPPQGAMLIGFGGDMSVYGDPCAWESTRPDDPAASLDELVAALSAQTSRDATAPVDVTVGGYPGKMLTLHVPEDAEFTDCDGGEFRTLIMESTSGDEFVSFHQGPGQIDEVWVVDVDGTLFLFDARYFPDTPAEDVEEMRAMVESATFEVR